MKLLVTVSGVVGPKVSQEIKKKKTKKGNESSKQKMGGNIKKEMKDEGRMLEATDITGMKVSNIFNDPSSFKHAPVSEEQVSSLH